MALRNDRIDVVGEAGEAGDAGDAGADGKYEVEAPCERYGLLGRVIFLGRSTFPDDDTGCAPLTTEDAIIDFCCCCCIASSMASFSSATISASDFVITSSPNPVTKTRRVLTLGGVAPYGVGGKDFSLGIDDDDDEVLRICWCTFLAAWFTKLGKYSWLQESKT